MNPGTGNRPPGSGGSGQQDGDQDSDGGNGAQVGTTNDSGTGATEEMTEVTQNRHDNAAATPTW